MYNYNTLKDEFLQYKHFLGMKYKTEKTVMNEIVQFLISNNINIITKDTVIKYACINPNISSNTLARNMGVFKEFCNFLQLQKGIACYQIPHKLYPQNHHNFIPYIFSHEEIKAIYSNIHYVDKGYRYSYYRQKAYPLIIKILYQTGMRIGEVLNLTKQHYNSELGLFTLVDTKNSKDRNVCLSSHLNKEIQTFIKKFNINDKLFTISNSSIEIYFKKVLRLSNITITDKGPRVHDLRFTFIVHSIEQAMNRKDDLDVFLPILQAQVGHSSLSSLAYYFHITNDILNITNKISEEELGYLIKEVYEDE